MANLSRPRQGRIIAGVCAAIADRFGWDRTLVRVLAVASILLPGPQVILYIVLWVLFPNDDTRRAGSGQGAEQVIHPAP